MNEHAEWTPDRVERMNDLWANGFSASQIARYLGSTTRNAVISKLHRLGSKNREPRGSKKPQRRTHVVVKPIYAIAKDQNPQEFLPLVLEDGSNVTLLTLANGMCKFPIGDPQAKDFHYCGHPANGRVYCAAHEKVCFQPSKMDK